MKKQNKIFIYAGHWNNDPGAIGFDSTKEADVTKLFRDMVSSAIISIDNSIEVINDDDSYNLSKVIYKTKGIISKGDILIDYHVNSASNKDARGFENFISDNAGQNSIALAEDLNFISHHIVNTNNRGVKKESQSNRGKLGILNMLGSAVLVELYFGSNELDTNNFRKYTHWLAMEHAQIIIHHFYKPGVKMFQYS